MGFWSGFGQGLQPAGQNIAQALMMRRARKKEESEKAQRDLLARIGLVQGMPGGMSGERLRLLQGINTGIQPGTTEDTAFKAALAQIQQQAQPTYRETAAGTTKQYAGGESAFTPKARTPEEIAKDTADLEYKQAMTKRALRPDVVSRERRNFTTIQAKDGSWHKLFDDGHVEPVEGIPGERTRMSISEQLRAVEAAGPSQKLLSFNPETGEMKFGAAQETRASLEKEYMEWLKLSNSLYKEEQETEGPYIKAKLADLKQRIATASGELTPEQRLQKALEAID